MSVQVSNPNSVNDPNGHYSQVAHVSSNSDLLFISGQGPQNMNGETVGKGDMTAQAEQVFKNLQAILKAHNASFTNAIKTTIYITDMSRLAEFNSVRAKYYAGAKPTSALVEVSALVDPDWLIEVELVAAV